MNALKRLWMQVLLMALPALAFASGGGIDLDKAPVNMSDLASLQRGAKFYAAYCLSCHGASFMRYNRLMELGMSEAQIRQDMLMPEETKIGSTMQAGMDAKTAEQVFGVAVPDLSVIARARSPDWIYTYLRSFYADSSRPGGWNNVIFPNVAMPNVLAAMQGEQALDHGSGKLVLTHPGSMGPAEFDATVSDLVNFLVYLSEPARLVRHKIGYAVLGFLFILFMLTYALKKEIWQDIKHQGSLEKPSQPANGSNETGC